MRYVTCTTARAGDCIRENGVQAYMPVSTRLFIGVLATLALVCCDWEPLTRPAQPELLIEGSFVIDAKLGTTDRYVLVRSNGQAATRFLIVDLRTRKSCELPEGTVDAGVVVLPPNNEPPDELTPFLISVEVETAPDKVELFTSNPQCETRGPYAIIGSGPSSLDLDGDKRGAFVFGNGMGQLSFFDPWSEQGNVIAKNVAGYVQVSRLSNERGYVGPQALWIFEGGALTQRTLSGELLVKVGKNVTQLVQGVYDTLRVAYVDGPDVYEIAGPDFRPFLIARDACSPLYFGTTLNIRSPCTPPQLVRFDLRTETREEFPKGVYWSYSDDGVLLEYEEVDKRRLLFATPPGGKRTQVVPTLFRAQVISGRRIAGASEDRTFGVWSQADGFLPLFENVVKLDPFIDVRASNYLWLIQHDEVDGLGRLSVFDQDSFELKTLATSVPVGGYTVEFLQPVPEPVVVSIEDVAQGELRGTLQVRLLSGELPSRIDDGVTSYEVIAAPAPGLLYTIAEGPKRGLWFAAL
jgi:hypothetical protein